MNWWTRLLQALIPGADTTNLVQAINDLNQLTERNTMTNPTPEPTGQVQIAQSDLDNFTSEINAAVSTLSTYIQQLVANQSTPLPAADEANLEAAITALQNLEPPAPTPPATS
jgi:hypothetical protein